MRRVFFALWPDPEWQQGLLAVASGPVAACGGRPVAGIDLHVTLCFVGAASEADLPGLCECAAALQSAEFELEFDALEYWPRSRVLAVTSSQIPEAAAALAGALRSAACSLGLRPAEQPLRPHVTLVRAAAAVAGSPRRALAMSPPLRLLARRMYLAQSHELGDATATGSQAARYARIASWPLANSGG
jgi:RNA 2',3'-cyclic 3'-phosphodiesterase